VGKHGERIKSRFEVHLPSKEANFEVCVGSGILLYIRVRTVAIKRRTYDSKHYCILERYNTV